MALSTKMKICLIDDESSSRKSIKEMLKRIGFKNIHDFELPNTAFDNLKKSIELEDPFKLVISDLDMPNLNGMELYDEVAKAGITVPFLLMSGSNDQAMIKQAVQNGIKNIILKPFSQADLNDRLARMLQGPAKKKAA